MKASQHRDRLGSSAALDGDARVLEFGLFGGDDSFPFRGPWERFESNSADEAAERIGSYFAPNKLTIRSPSTLHTRLHRASLGGMWLSSVWHGSELQLQTRIPEDYYLLSLVTSGTGALDSQSGWQPVTTGSLVVLNPDYECLTRFSENYSNITIQMNRNILRQMISQEMDRALPTEVTFGLKPVDFSNALSLFRFIMLCCQEISDDGATQHRLAVATNYERTLVSLLLDMTPHNLEKWMNPSGSWVAPYYVKRAEEYINENFSRSCSLTDLAQAAGVSPRTLNYGFQRFRETTPMAYLKAVRLEHVRALLCANNDRSVSDIAFDSGFTHMSKFCRYYHQRFGELPSATRRRIAV
ncbi:MAG TPA: AraC family transcriptional regulator [Allosphingosinicella sp.]|nr:AraC family transcriptional regulator [Allosphingosinicella sp.]